MKLRSRVVFGVLVLASSACVPDPTTDPPPLPNNTPVVVVGGVPRAGGYPQQSADGRYVLYQSPVNDIVPPYDDGGNWGIYRWDRTTNTTEVVSLSATNGNPDSKPGDVMSRHQMTDDGRYIVYSSSATNLGPAPDARSTAFIRDMVTHTTIRLVPSSVPAGCTVGGPQISGNGEWVTFGTNNADCGTSLPGSQRVLWNRLTDSPIVRINVGYAGHTIVAPHCTGTFCTTVPTVDPVRTFGAFPLNNGMVVYNTNADNVVPGVIITSPPSPDNVYLVQPGTENVVNLGLGRSYNDAADSSSDGRYIGIAGAGLGVNGRNRVYDTVTHTFDYPFRRGDGTDPAQESLLGMSPNGRFVMTMGYADELGVDASHDLGMVMQDRQTGKVYRITRKDDGSPYTATGLSAEVAQISDDGHWAAFSYNSWPFTPTPIGSTVLVANRTPVP